MPKKGLCQCGCGNETNINPKTKKPYDFLKGHSRRTKTLPDGKLVCRNCNKAKEIDEFVVTRGRPRWCKKCYADKQREYYQGNRKQYSRAAKNRALKRKYGIDINEFETLLKKQKNRCAICNTKLDISWNGKWKTGMEKNSRVDHCHKTGRVRGILCHHCNYGLGAFKDNLKTLERAALYLKERS